MFDDSITVISAGTKPSSSVHPLAIKVMLEEGVDLRNSYPKLVDNFLNEDFDYVITVCGDAKETCPVFKGTVKNRIHIGFNDPAQVKGTYEFVLLEFRKIRNEIKQTFLKFYKLNLVRK